jgi:hypothetical protein
MRIFTPSSSELSILRVSDPTAYQTAGFSYVIKFNLKQVLDLPYGAVLFLVPPVAPRWQLPNLGT